MSNTKLFLIALIALSVSIWSAYYIGKTNAEAKYSKQLEIANARIKTLEARESVIEKEVVTEYKDRVRVVKQIEEKIVEVTKYVLREEASNCTIGPGFIGLHNAAASGQNLPGAASGTDGSTKTP